MARGYLGKISAIVSANTGNYVRGLDESARRTAAFAKTIQSDLRNASRDASKSIDAILTPLQRVERALQNARSQRLSFRGFDGAIRTVEDLRKRIGSLELGDRELAVRVSGLRSIDALNKAIEGIKQEDIDLAVRVGGVDGIRRLRQQVQEVNGQVINVQTGRSAENLDFLISKFQALSAQRIQQVQIAVETAQLDRAEVAFKRTASVATQIAAPLGAAVQQLTTLSAGVQTAFGPALQIAQRAVENLGKTIEANGRISDNTFERTAQRVERTTQAINRLSEASRIAGSAATGVELGFVAPRVRQELTASAATRNAAAESADPSRFASRVQQAAQIDDLIVARQAEVESIRASGGDFSRAQKQLNDLLETSRRLRASIDEELQVDVDAAAAQERLRKTIDAAYELGLALNRDIDLAIDGPREIEQLQAAARALVGELGRLDAVQKSIARPRLQALSDAIATNDIEQIRTAFGQAKAAIEQGIRVTADTKSAEDRIAALGRLAQSLNREIVLAIDGPQDIEQLQVAARGLVGELGRLNSVQQSIARPRLEELTAAIATGDIDQIRVAFERAKAAIERGIVVTVNTKSAEDRIAALDRLLNARLAGGLGPRVTNEQVDSEFSKLTTSLASLSTQNQLNLDPTIQELRDAIAAGENLERQYDRIVAAQERVALAAKIESLPEGSRVRQRAQEFFDRESAGPPSGPSQLGPAVDDAKARIDAFGLPVQDSVRRLGVLQGAIASVKGQVDQLPIPLQTRFVPLLSQAEAEFQRLKNSGTATAAEIKKAADEVTALRSQVDLAAKASSAFGGTFAEFADASAVQGAQGRLQALRQVLLGAAGDTSRAVEAADDLAAAFNRAASTPGGFKEFSAQLDQVEKEAVQAAAAVLNISPEQLADRLKRAGDVSRNGLGNVQLAVQQAAFAVDDFFSVTGDLSQRIRAAGNNISQLGFILGGIVPGLTATQGLIAGIAVSIGAQLVVQIIKWTNAGRTAEDQTKSLNDALARQKSLVEELAQAFNSLGDSIARRAFSGPAQEARAFAKEIDEVVRKQKELRDQRALSLDEGVVQARADVSVAERQLGQATTRDQAVAAQRRLEEARTRLARQEALVRTRPALTPADTLGSIEEIFNQAARRAATTAAGRAGGAGGGVGGAIAADVARRQVDERRVELQRRVAAAGDPAEAVRILRAEQAASAQRGDDRLVAQLEELINRIRTQTATTAADEFAVSLIASANAASLEIEQAQSRVADAIGAGSVSALELRASLDALGSEIDAATTEISSAQADFSESGQTDEDAARRDNRVRAVQQQIDAAQRQARALTQRSADVALESLARPDRAGPALQALQSSEAFANEYAGLTAQLQSAIEREKFAREQANTSNNAATQAQLKAAQAATQLAAAAAEAAIKINAGFDRFRASIQSFAQETQRAADEAQDRVNRAGRVGGPPVDVLERDRDRAERNREADEQFVRNIENQLQAALARLPNDPEFQRQSARLNELNAQRDAAAARAIQTNVPEDPRITAARTAEIAKAEQGLNEIRKRAEEGIRRQAEAELRLRDARNQQEAFRRAEQDRRQPAGDAVRGLDAIGGARQRAQDEARQRLADIEAARRARRLSVEQRFVPEQDGTGRFAEDTVDFAIGGDVRKARQQLDAAQQRLDQERFRARQRPNLLAPTKALASERERESLLADIRLGTAQQLAAVGRAAGADLPQGARSVEQAQQAIENARELLQQVSLLGANARPEDFAALGQIFPLPLTDEGFDPSNLVGAEFEDDGLKLVREGFAKAIADVAAQLDDFVRAGQPSIEAAQAESDAAEERRQEAQRGLREIKNQPAPNVAAAEEAVKAAQAAFDQVNQPFADLERNERDAAEARRRAIEDITDLGLSDERRFERGLADNLGLVQGQAEEFLGIGDRQAAIDSLNNAQNNLARQNAPLFAQFSDEVANAVLQGPSRAALQASDASTSEGQRELNRLLRGEDSARDVNFVELQKQSTFLQSIDTGIAGLRQQLGLAE